MKVRVHTNRHRIKANKADIWSVLDAKTGLLIDHRESITLTGCTFKVQPGGLRRVQEGGKRTVFAWVEGTIAEGGDSAGEVVTFNPHQHTAFQAGGGDVHTAERVTFNGLQVLAAGAAA